jgi:Mg-chelatase subunit ChlD
MCNYNLNIVSFILSFIIHCVIILLLFNVDLAFTHNHLKEEVPAITILSQQQNDAQFIFQSPQPQNEFKIKGTNAFDELKAENPEPPPYQKIESYGPLPEMKFTPDIRVRENVNRIGAPTLDRSLLSGPKGPADTMGGQGLPYYGTGAKLSGSFGRDIQGVRKIGLDVVFVFDATSSMAQFLRQVKYKIVNLCMTFKMLVPTTRIGLIAYRDNGDDFVTKAYPLTHRTQQLQKFLQGINPVGGGDYEEAVYEGLRKAIDEFNWHKGSKKIILVIGDAPPHKQDMQKAKELITKFRNLMGGMVSTLDTSNKDNRIADPGASHSVLSEFKELAEAGGGECALMTDEVRVIRQMVVLTFGTRWESYLDEFLKNL